MTHKDFTLIADVIWDLPIQQSEHDKVVEAFADALEQANPRFDREWFVEAATDWRYGEDV